MAEALALYEAETLPYRIDTTAIFHRNVTRLGKAQDAADRWLTDPENPEQYDLGPRAYELEVVYLDHRDLTQQGEPKRKRATLQALLARAEGGGLTPVSAESKFSDPRDYLLKSSEQLRGELTLFMQAYGQWQEDEREKARTAQAAENQEQELRDVLETALAGRLEGILVARFGGVLSADVAATLASHVAAGVLEDIIGVFREAGEGG